MEEVNELIEQRHINLDKMKSRGMDPFGGVFKGVSGIASIKEAFEEGKEVRIAGRIMARREHGKSAFMDVKDRTERIQVYFRKDFLGDDAFENLKAVDIGDIIGVDGKLFLTRSGEKTLQVTSFKMISDLYSIKNIINKEYLRIRNNLQKKITPKGSKLRLTNEPEWIIWYNETEQKFIFTTHQYDLMYAADIEFIVNANTEKITDVFAREWFKGE